MCRHTCRLGAHGVASKTPRKQMGPAKPPHAQQSSALSEKPPHPKCHDIKQPAMYAPVCPHGCALSGRFCFMFSVLSPACTKTTTFQRELFSLVAYAQPQTNLFCRRMTVVRIKDRSPFYELVASGWLHTKCTCGMFVPPSHRAPQSTGQCLPSPKVCQTTYYSFFHENPLSSSAQRER